MKLDLGGFKGQNFGYLAVNIQGNYDIKHDLNEMPWAFENNSTDAVIMTEVIEHLDKPRDVMDEIWRICKHGAKVKMSVPWYGRHTILNNPEHLHDFNPDWFRAFDPTTHHGSILYGMGSGDYTCLKKAIFKIEQIKVRWVLKRIHYRIPKLLLPRRHQLYIYMKVIKDETRFRRT